MGITERWSVPLSPLAKKLLGELEERFPWSSRGALVRHALDLGLAQMHAMPSVASGAPMIEWRRAG